MKRYRVTLILAAAAAASGCASVQPLGHDLYSSDAVRPIVAANNFCRKQGKLAEPVQQAGRYDFVFRCVAP